MRRVTKLSITGLILIALLAGVGYAAYLHFRPTPALAVIKDPGPNLSDFSAVFVSGGGIYFGKIVQLTDSVLSLEEVYNYGVLPTDSNASSSSSNSANNKPTLFDASKVGIAPSSRYNINRSQVILWYSLKNDSDVVKTITAYKAQ